MSDTNVIGFPGAILDLEVIGPDDAPVSDVIEMLERLLAEAKRGELRDMIYAATTSDNSVRTGFTISDDRLRQYAAACRLVHRLNVELDSQTSDVDRT